MEKKNRRVGPKVETDVDFADDIALLSEEINHAQELLLRIEKQFGKVGLKRNAGKTEFIAFNNKASQEKPSKLAMAHNLKKSTTSSRPTWEPGWRVLRWTLISESLQHGEPVTS